MNTDTCTCTIGIETVTELHTLFNSNLITVEPAITRTSKQHWLNTADEGLHICILTRHSVASLVTTLVSNTVYWHLAQHSKNPQQMVAGLIDPGPYPFILPSSRDTLTLKQCSFIVGHR